MLALLPSCAPGGDVSPCVPADVTFAPEHGAVDVAADVIPTVTVSDPSASPRLWVDGGVTGTWAPQGGGMWAFVADAPFAHSAAFTMLAEVCNVETTSTFHTRGPTVGPASVGRAYRMELDAPDIVFEPTLASIIVDYMGESESLLFYVAAVGEDTIDMVTAPGWVPVTHGRFAQYPCAEPFTFTADFSSNPLFVSAPSDVVLQATSPTGQSFGLYEFVATGELTEDGSVIRDLEVYGLVDLSDLGVGLEVACGLAAAADAPCEPCQAGSTDATCVRLRLTDPSAPAVDIAFSDTADVEACP